MSGLDAVLAASTRDGERITTHIPDDWMQGRTAYGGISSALALDAVHKLLQPEPPLRTALISFIGPVGGESDISVRTLRQSKSSQFITADVSSAIGYGTQATFTFSHARASHVDHDTLAMPDVPPPDALEPVPPHPLRPSFTSHFDMRPVDGPTFAYRQSQAHYLCWVRFHQEPTCHPTIALLALGDALPPAAMALFDTFGPISSMNWTVHMLTDTPQTDDGWWLLSSRAPWVRRGSSVQTMTLWNRAGEPVATGGQMIGLYV